MQKTRILYPAIFFLLSLAYVSCQPKSISNLKACLKECGIKYEEAADECTLIKNKTKQMNCVQKASMTNARCAQACSKSYPINK